MHLYFGGAILAQGLASAPQTAASKSAPGGLLVYAAGSLREPLTTVVGAYEMPTGVTVNLTFGASGLLRERMRRICLAGQAALKCRNDLLARQSDL